jgi:hypothetical protein
MFTSAPALPGTWKPVHEPLPQPTSTAPSTQVLISTQQVRFSTAAAVGVRRQSIGERIVAGIRQIFAASAEESRPRPQYEPRRYGFLENALMAREMGRL